MTKQQELRQYKQAIRAFIREHWSDQKLAEVRRQVTQGPVLEESLVNAR